MVDDAPFTDVKAFVKRQRTAGRYKATSGKNLETACALVEQLLEESDSSVRYVEEHLDSLIERYSNLNPQAGKASLVAYKSRILRALRDYRGHRTDSQWQPGKRGTRPAVLVPVKRPTVISDPPRESTLNILRHRLPLRANFDVEVVLPRDFSAKEAGKVSAWIATLTLGEDV